MKTKKITGYFCDHCNKLYQRKHFAIKHEERCFKNPANNRPCLDCKHCNYEDATIYEDLYDRQVEKTYKVFYCEKKEHYLIPPIARQKHGLNVFDFDDVENIDMPTKCKDFDGWDLDDLLRLPFE